MVTYSGGQELASCLRQHQPFLHLRRHAQQWLPAVYLARLFVHFVSRPLYGLATLGGGARAANAYSLGHDRPRSAESFAFKEMPLTASSTLVCE
jgi:hypothetical protein